MSKRSGLAGSQHALERGDGLAQGFGVSGEGVPGPAPNDVFQLPLHGREIGLVRANDGEGAVEHEVGVRRGLEQPGIVQARSVQSVRWLRSGAHRRTLEGYVCAWDGEAVGAKVCPLRPSGSFTASGRSRPLLSRCPKAACIGQSLAVIILSGCPLLRPRMRAAASRCCPMSAHRQADHPCPSSACAALIARRPTRRGTSRVSEPCEFRVAANSKRSPARMTSLALPYPPRGYA